MNLTRELELIAESDDFESLAEDLLATVRADDIATNLSLVREVLVFMEGHECVNFGLPGSVAIFIEHIDGYEAVLVESVNRKPVAYNLTLLRRLINSTEGRRREYFLDVMASVVNRGGVDEDVKQIAREGLA